MRKLYGEGARISIVYETAIVPEASGKYQLARSLFPVDMERYLDGRYYSVKGTVRSEDT